MKKKSFIAVLSVFALATTFGAAACKKNQECEHESWTTKQGNGYHYQECENCGIIDNIGLHEDKTADGKCDVCGADVVAPTYVWKHDDNSHWQEIDGKKENLGGHIDLNGAAGGGADGKCDTCDAAIKLSVSFDLNGKGHMSPVSVEYGKKAAKPDDPTYFGYVFGGWYSDYELQNEFDFEQNITASTTVYAKWEENETPGTGYNPGHAVVSSLATQSFKTFGEAQKLYFKLTVEEGGRYQVDLRGAASDKCTYVTDIDSDKYTVIDNGTTYFDLEEGDSVVVEVTRGEDVADDEVCAPYFLTVSNEKLSSAWKTGAYVAGAYEITLNANNLVYTAEDSGSPVSFNYIGGKTNTLSFSYGSTAYTATLNKNGDIVLKKGNATEGTFKYYDENKTVTLAQFEGAYKLVDGQSSNVLEFGFDGEESLYIVEKSGTSQTKSNYKIGHGSTLFYKKSGTIVIDTRYFVTLNINADGDVTGVNISSGLGGTVYSYTHDGHMIPSSIPVVSGESFAGHLYQFAYSEGRETAAWGSALGNVVAIKAYDFDTKTYTIANGSTQYKLDVEFGEDGKKTFYIYDLEGKLLDTLVPFVGYDYSHALPSTDTDLDINIKDFLLSDYYLEVKEGGWYVLKSTSSLSVTINMVKGANGNVSGGTVVSLGDSAVKLAAGSYVKLSIVGDHPESVSLSVSKDTDGSKAPVGTYASNPVELNGTGSFDSVVGFDEYVYYNCTVSKPGVYLVTISDKGIKYYINGSEEAAKVTDTVTLTEGNLSFTLKAEVKDVAYSWVIEEDCTKGTALSPDEDGKGSLTASGAYFLNDFDKIPYARSLKLKLNTEDEDAKFKITINGTEVEVSSYSFADKDALAHGFVITLADVQTLGYEINYNNGAKQNPIEIKNVGSVSGSLTAATQVKYFKITAPNVETENYSYIVSVSGKDSESLNVEVVSGNLKLAKGESVTIAVSYNGEATQAEGDKEEFKALSFNVNLFYDFTENAQPLNFDEFETGDKTDDGTVAAYSAIEVNPGKTLYHVDSTYGGNIVITGYSKFSVVNGNAVNSATKGEGGVFTVTIPAGEDIYFELTSEKKQLLTFVFSCAAGTVFNPYEVKEFNQGVSDAYKFSSGSTYFTLPAGTYAYIGTDGDLYITSEENGSELVQAAGLVFTIYGNEKLEYVSNSAGSIYFSYKVAPELRGTYSGKGNKFIVNATSLISHGKTYTLASIVDGEYKYEIYGLDEDNKVVVKESLTIAISDFGGSYGDDELNFIPMFVEDVENAWDDVAFNYVPQTFRGELNYTDQVYFDLTFTLSKGGVATLSGNAGSGVKFYADPVDVTDNGDGTYSFPYRSTHSGLGSGTITFTFAEDGIISFRYSNQFAYRHDMTPDVSFNPFANLWANFTDEEWGNYVGSYQDSSDKTVTLTLTFDKYGDGKFVYADGLNDVIFVSPNYDEGGYVFKYGNNVSAQFTFNEDGNVELNYNGNTVTLISSPMFSSSQTGEYKGSYDPWGWGADPVSLTFDKLGKGTFGYLGNYAITINDKGNGSYSFTYGSNTATFTLNDNGSIALTLGNSTITIAKEGAGGPVGGGELKAGIFIGKLGPTTVSLNINENLTDATYNDGDDDYEVTITKNDNGSYSFTIPYPYNPPTCTMVVNSDGSLTITDSYGQTFTLGGDVNEDPKLPEGTYIGTDSDGWVYTLVVNADGTVDYGCVDDEGNGAPPSTGIEVSYENNVWSFTYNYFQHIEITLGYYESLFLNDDILLELQKDPEIPEGNYEGTYEGWIYKLVANGDGTVDYIYGPDESNTGGGTNLQLTYADDTWTFQYTAFGSGITMTAYITLGEDGKLILDDDITLTLQVPKLAAGTYTGTVVAEAWDEDEEDTLNKVILVIEEDGSATFKLLIGEDETVETNWQSYDDATITYTAGGFILSYGGGNAAILTDNGDGSLEFDDYFVGVGTLTSVAK